MTQSFTRRLHREIEGDRLIEIYDEGDTRALYFGGKYLQSRMSLSSPHILTLPYTRYMMFGLLLTPCPERVLLIGIGAGSMVRFLHHHFPLCSIDAVDHSSHVIHLARGYFKLPENKQIHIHCEDGLKFLTRNLNRKKYDLILIDAFDEKGMSNHIYSSSFFRLCADALSSHGTLACNIWSGKQRSATRISSLLSSLFAGKIVLPVPRRGNVINQMRPAPIDWKRLVNDRHRLQQLSEDLGLNFSSMVETALRHNCSPYTRLYWSLRQWMQLTTTNHLA